MSTEKKLTGKQRRWLFKKAHDLDPVVIIGKAGPTRELVQAVDAALSDHELLKVKFNDYKDEKKDIAAFLSKETGAYTVWIIGNTVVFYRQNKDTEKRQYNLPK
ncbi:MAG: ribosome assembly RNA-binding protein YhbY [Spirochaetia bacterium]